MGNTSMYKTDRVPIEQYLFSGTANLTHTLASGTAAVNNGDGTVTVSSPEAHGIAAGSRVYFSGTTNYEGVRDVISLPTASGLKFKADYVAETFDGTETVSYVVAPGCDFILIGIEMHLSSAPNTADVFSCTVDSNAGSAWDQVVYSTTMVSGTTTDISSSSIDKYFFDGDKLVFAFANTDGRLCGIKTTIRRVR